MYGNLIIKKIGSLFNCLRTVYTKYITLPIFIKDTLHLSDSEYGYTQTISRFASFMVFGLLAKYLTINLTKSFKPLLFSLFALYGISIWGIGYVTSIENLYIVYSLSEVLLFTAVVLVHAYIQSVFSQDELTLACGSVSTGFSIGSILSITIFTNLANIIPIHDIFYICGLGIVVSTVFIMSICFLVLCLFRSQDLILGSF